MNTRRKFLKIIGGGTILAAGGGAAFLATRHPEKALAPWTQAGQYDEPRMQALSYAILAPNPHNRQPWLVGLDSPGQVEIWRDKDKNLPETDPFDRQLTIGMGCFLEQLAIAASASGHLVDFDLFPNGEDGPVAVANFKTGASVDPLFNHVLSRRSCKEPFNMETPDVPDALKALADIYTDTTTVEQLQQLTFDAWLLETGTYEKMKESTDLFRLGKAEIEANPDGIDFSGAFFELAILAGMLSREGSLNTESFEYAEAIKIYKKMLFATPAYAVIKTSDNTRQDQINAGRQWMRLNLTTTAAGLALHPVSQVLQEYSEMKNMYDQAHQLLAEPGETVQMLGRLGYGPTVPSSPRWPIEAKLI